MTEPQLIVPKVESYRFWDVVTLWARERLEHEEIVARGLARAVVCEGLRIQSIDPRWLEGADRRSEFRGRPYVGFCAKPGAPLCLLCAEALEHLLAVVHRDHTPQREKLWEEFCLREDFRGWARAGGLPLPKFWFGEEPSI